MRTVHFETFGCQMNVADSDQLACALSQEGYHLTDNAEGADLVVVNTCSVRAHAEDRARARIVELANAKRKRHPNQRLWVIGCMAQRLGETLREQIPGVDRVVGTGAIESFQESLSELLADTDSVAVPPPAAALSTFVPVMRGCDNFCAYCIVPHVRGREHSLELEVVANTVRAHVARGAKEITLLGQNVNSYHDTHGHDFPALLRQLHRIEGLERLRFTTSHPKDCSDELIRTMATLPKLCTHFHLPVQSGATPVLQRMNRKYTRDDYLRIIDKMRTAIPQVDITTDVMTGFPGETDTDFEQTLALFRQVRFTTAFMFAFSPRTGTAAATMDGQVPPSVAKERLNTLIELQTGITREIYEAAVGTHVQVLITERQQKRDRMWVGRDHGCKRVLVSCSSELTGTILEIPVTRSSGMTLIAEEVSI